MELLVVVVILVFAYCFIADSLRLLIFHLERRKWDLKGCAIDWSPVEYEAERLKELEEQRTIQRVR